MSGPFVSTTRCSSSALSKASRSRWRILDDRALGAIEIEPQAEFYDYGAKYVSGDTRYHLPPRLSGQRVSGLLTQALRAHRALGCSGATRVDFIVSETGNEYVLEVNTVPGLTPTSLLPKIAHGAGIEFDALCEAMLHGARRASWRGRGQSVVASPRTAVGAETDAAHERAVGTLHERAEHH